jgi:hypothetical protein
LFENELPGKNGQNNVAGILFIMIQSYRGFLEIFLICSINIDKLLWIPVHQRKPAALNLHHYAMAFCKGMGNVLHIEFYMLCLIGYEGFRILFHHDCRQQSPRHGGIKYGV